LLSPLYVACTVWFPAEGAGIVKLAVEEGVDAVTGDEPTVAPSTVKVTVPVGGVPGPGGVMVTDSVKLVPGGGVVVEGVKTTVGVTDETLIVYAVEVEVT